MKLHFDEDLVEGAVFRCAAGKRRGISAFHIARFHREREKLYSILDPDERNAAFFRLHLEWFREWGLESLLSAALGEFPELAKDLTLLAFRKSRGKKDEGAELYVNDSGDRTGVISLCPERLEHELELAPFLRHELMHLRDMLDPGFGYRPDLAMSGRIQSQHSLARERYRLLWDVSIDGRISRTGKPTVATRDQRWSEFNGACTFWTEEKRQEIFDSLWANPNPTHAALEAWVCDPRQLQSGAGPRPGAPCPLCGFPTFAWADAALNKAQADRIRTEFPDWAREHGICGRCFAVYRSLGLETPLVV